MKTCTVSGCSKPLLARGYCSMHWERWRKHGDPLGGRAPNGEQLKFIEKAVAYRDPDCLFWPYGISAGYGWIASRSQYAHRVVCERVHGPAPAGLPDVAHACAVKRCVNPAHLRWATHQDNMHDIIRAKGHGPNHKLGREDVMMIRALALTVPQKQLAKRYGVSIVTVWNIVNRKTWKHL